jgi:hypothetical protein
MVVFSERACEKAISFSTNVGRNTCEVYEEFSEDAGGDKTRDSTAGTNLNFPMLVR